MRRILIIFFLAAGTMLLVFRHANWYAQNSAIPRFCHNPRETVFIVEEIMTLEAPTEGKERRPYIIAAKLIFLVPQEENEPMDVYLARLNQRISETCGTAY